jgi:hypothetical protein
MLRPALAWRKPLYEISAVLNAIESRSDLSW